MGRFTRTIKLLSANFEYILRPTLNNSDKCDSEYQNVNGSLFLHFRRHVVAAEKYIDGVIFSFFPPKRTRSKIRTCKVKFRESSQILYIFCLGIVRRRRQ